MAPEVPCESSITFRPSIMRHARSTEGGRQDSRTEQPDLEFTGNFAAVANRVAGPADNFKRRRAIADTLLRNTR